ncbi:hypothetical protein Vadar_002608 [Vaccinium darrowii]|uniref:Uncharacterized protein n=1 Tax=Vaccinium darrowii TaxID=229202 RepID=A0ACB7Y5Z1_9ERIC|nr:hypothetical protein Vadar_002608 [Vaccinium darrowii]
MLELLSNHRLTMLSPVFETEVKRSVKEVYEKWEKKGSCLVEMKKWFDDMTLKLAVRLIAGNGKAEVDEGYREAFRAFFELMGVFTVADAIPFLRWLDLGGYEKEMKRIGKKMDDLLQEWLDEHKRRKISCEVAEVEAEKGFMELMLEILDGGTNDALNFDAETISKATCLRIFSPKDFLMTHKDVDLRGQHFELLPFGSGRRGCPGISFGLHVVQFTLASLVHAFEIATPANEPVDMGDCIVGGYHVPAGTTLFVNLWKVHRDPQLWPNPEDFQPKRFLTTHKDVDLRGQHFELLPFGSGRRGCPGISFGLHVVQFTLASLVHAFEIATPANEPVDMGESFGFTNVKAMPLEVILTPPLPPKVYG